MMSQAFLLRTLPAVAFAAAFTVTPQAAADAVADFYTGRTIELTVAEEAGSDSGRYARLLSDFLPAHIPGRPALTPKFMPGAEGIDAANYIYNVAPRDGAAIALLLSSQAMTEAFGREGVRYKSASMGWVGRIADLINVVTVRRFGPATTVEALRNTDLVAGATVPGSMTHMPFAIMNWALGTRFRIVHGYKGSMGPALAFDRDEIHAVSAPWETVRTRRPQLLKEIQLVQVALAGDRLRADVPLLLELVTDPEKKAAVTFLSAPASIGRTVSVPPRVPEDRLAALRKAFDATMKNAGFIAAVRKHQLRLAPLSGVQVEKIVLEHLSTPAGIVRVAKTAAGIK